MHLKVHGRGKMRMYVQTVVITLRLKESILATFWKIGGCVGIHCERGWIFLDLVHGCTCSFLHGRSLPCF